MLTVARNMAIGLGMSAAEGTIPTNGVQPLATGVYSLCFALAGGDKTAGVAWVMAVSVAISVIAGISLFRLARAVLVGNPHRDGLAAFAAALWFASPRIIGHSMNALETGLYLAITAEAMRYYLLRIADGRSDRRNRNALALGLLLGVAFWARNDAVFLIAAICITHCFVADRSAAIGMARRFRESILIGVASFVVAAPWMIFNLIGFGSVVPISGKSEWGHGLAPALPYLPARLFEYLCVVGAIPVSALTSFLVQGASSAVLLAAAILAVHLVRSRNGVIRTSSALALWHALLICIYYGVFFGAPYFLSRYLAPLSMMIAIFFVTATLGSARGPEWRWGRVGLACALALAAVGLSARQYVRSAEHMHFQVVEWVRDHVAPEEWVGAVQTGTLGFFHDRTINLDGKTNPAALELKDPRKMRDYVVKSKITYIVDWQSISEWEPLLAPEFELVVNDADQNLAVLKRVR